MKLVPSPWWTNWTFPPWNSMGAFTIGFSGVGKCPNVSHHPTIGEIISNRYLFRWCSKSPKRDIYQPLFLHGKKHGTFFWWQNGGPFLRKITCCCSICWLFGCAPLAQAHFSNTKCITYKYYIQTLHTNITYKYNQTIHINQVGSVLECWVLE